MTVTDEKDFDTSHSAEELAKNLARHGIEVVLDKIDAGGKPIGEVLETYVRAHRDRRASSMGAYGHARWREFILGGATKSMLSRPQVLDSALH